jgi:hypothetical protein
MEWAVRSYPLSPARPLAPPSDETNPLSGVCRGDLTGNRSGFRILESFGPEIWTGTMTERG